MAEPIESIPPEVAHHLGYYVYLYVDPRTEKPFYVGKGQGERVLAHLGAAGDSMKARILGELRAEGLEPRLDILAHGLADEETALRIEAAVIDLLGIDKLANNVRGVRSLQFGRLPISELVAYYAAPPVTILDPVLLIRINSLYRHGMSARELYDVTRGIWKIGLRRRTVRYAFAVFDGVVREVYEIDAWHRPGTTPYTARELTPRELALDRWEFTGHPASDEVRSRYLNHSVRAYFTRGARWPTQYVNA